jgi:predicted  nucleic acid-binding Zn-ribbon protein
VSDEHCVDCCCARSWRALGISEFTGRSIPEEIERLRARVAELEAKQIEDVRAMVELHRAVAEREEAAFVAFAALDDLDVIDVLLERWPWLEETT